MEPTVEDLVAEAGVKNIDQECCNKDLLHLADFCYPWQVVGGHLKLSELELGDIDDDNKSSELKRLGVLQKWKQKSFKATYRVLVGALISCKRNQQALKVCQYLARKEAEQGKEETGQKTSTDDSISIGKQPAVQRAAENQREVGRRRVLNKKGENTPEHRTLIKCTADLSKAVRADIHTLSGELLGDGLITSDNRDWLNNDAVNLSRRAPELVSMVATKVELDASNFHLFIKTLMRRLNDHREILEMLDSEYKSKGGDVNTGVDEALASHNQGNKQNAPGEIYRYKLFQPALASTKPTDSQSAGTRFYLIAAVPVVVVIILAVVFSLRGGDKIVASDTYSNDFDDRSLPHKPTLPKTNSLDGDRGRDHPAPYTHSSSYSSKRNNFPHMNDRPTMPELSNLKRSGGQNPVKIIERIGGEKSSALGDILLKDEHGVRMKNIKHEERSIEAVNREMFRQWLQGGGARVSWKALVDALDTVGLNTLADDMIDALSNAD